MKSYLNRFSATIILLILTSLLVPMAFAQETTAGLQGTVKDQTGAIITKARVEVTSPVLVGVKKMETDAGGNFRFVNLPPGVYTITITAQNFRTYKQEKIELLVGRLPTIDITLQLGTASETVEVTGDAPLVDVSQSKVATTISQQVLTDIPKGASYQSLIQLAPGARNEPLQAPTNGNAIAPGFSTHQGTNQGNGYQIDGASNTESSYLVEGMETASAFDGASSANVPMEFIQELQVKTSGFEAEHGGALGGVVNVVQQRGSNALHGSVFTYLNGDAFDAAPDRALRYNPDTASSGRFDQTAQFYQPKKDQYRILQPGFTLGGALLKDRLFFFTAFEPRLATLTRKVNFNSSDQYPTRPDLVSPTPGPHTFHENINTYYTLNRLDFAATQKIRLFGSWQYSYDKGTGTNLPNADSAYAGFRNTTAGNSANNYTKNMGYVAPNVMYGAGADITLNPNLVATTRFGYFYSDYQDRGLPTGIQYWFRNTSYNYSTASATNGTASFVAMDGSGIPQELQHGTNWTNIGTNSNTFFDKLNRLSFNQDLGYFKKFAGTHNLKIGYGFNKSGNDTFQGFNTADVYVGYGLKYTANSDGGIANCDAIIAANILNYGAAAGAKGCQGNFGTVNLRDVTTIGKVNGWNHAIFVQDAWTVGHGVTINAGLRTEKESIPSYTKGTQGISFGWQQKMAPRLGAAWDLFQNGKMKLFGSFGYFYQVMNLQLARGSFGGDYWHDCAYALDVADFTQIKPARNSDGFYCPKGGGSALAVGSFPANGMRFIENYDYRTPANDPNQAGSFGATGAVDPNLDPMKQHEMVIGTDVELKKSLGLEIRYSRKRLDRTIEDAGVLTNDGEMYYIVNPGYNANAAPACPTCPATPKANRRYDGLETRLTYKGTGNWFGSLSYTYSRYYGNYSGLTSTDQSDSNRTGGRNGANSDRAFDEPFMSFNPDGKVIDGPLSTDRPHSFKAHGYYRLKWFGMETAIGGFQQWYSGTPLTSYLSVWGAPVFTANRGLVADISQDAAGNWVLNGVSEKRTPVFSQTDLNMVHSLHVSKTNERLMASFQVNLTNVFNQHSVTDINTNLIASSGYTSIRPLGGDAAAMIGQGYNFITSANSTTRPIILNSMYGKPYLWQTPRSMRFQFKFTF